MSVHIEDSSVSSYEEIYCYRGREDSEVEKNDYCILSRTTNDTKKIFYNLRFECPIKNQVKEAFTILRTLVEADNNWSPCGKYRHTHVCIEFSTHGGHSDIALSICDDIREIRGNCLFLEGRVQGYCASSGFVIASEFSYLDELHLGNCVEFMSHRTSLELSSSCSLTLNNLPKMKRDLKSANERAFKRIKKSGIFQAFSKNAHFAGNEYDFVKSAKRAFNAGKDIKMIFVDERPTEFYFV